MPEFGLITGKMAEDIHRNGRASIKVLFTEPDGTEGSFTQYFEDRERAAEIHDLMIALFPCADCGQEKCACPDV